MENHRLVKKKSVQSYDSFLTYEVTWLDSFIPELSSYLTETKTATDLKSRIYSCCLINKKYFYSCCWHRTDIGVLLTKTFKHKELCEKERIPSSEEKRNAKMRREFLESGKWGKQQVEYEAEFVTVLLAGVFKETLHRKSTAGKGEQQTSTNVHTQKRTLPLQGWQFPLLPGGPAPWQTPLRRV